MSRRDQLLVSVLVTVAAMVAFWFLALSPKRDDASALQGQIDAAQTLEREASAEAAGYGKARSTFAANYRSVAGLGKAVPVDDDVRSLVVQLESAAQRAGVDFRLIEVSGGGGASSASAAPAPAPTPTAGTPAAATPAATTPAAPTQAVTATLPPGASVGPAGLGTMPFTFSFRGSFFELSDFFAQLERMVRATNKKVTVTGRLLQLDGVQLKHDTDGFPHIRAKVVATSYLVPPAEGLFAGATPAGPAKASPIPVTDRSAAAAPAPAAAGGTGAATTVPAGTTTIPTATPGGSAAVPTAPLATAGGTK